MSIEIRQMVIKSNVQQPAAEAGKEEGNAPDYDEMKKSIFEACRRMVVELMQEKEKRER